MRIASYRGESSVADLVARLFPSTADQWTAEAIGRTLLKTNPHLGNLESLKDGAPIAVPDDLPTSPEATTLNPYAEIVAQRVASRPREEGLAWPPDVEPATPAVPPEPAPVEEKPAKAKRSKRTLLRKKK